MKRPNMIARAVAHSAAVLCGGLAIAFADVGGNSGIEGHVLIEGGNNVVEGGNPVAGGNLIEGRSVSVDRLTNGSTSWGGFRSPCFPDGYHSAYAYGLYGACSPR
jgi:hypothetical protein